MIQRTINNRIVFTLILVYCLVMMILTINLRNSNDFLPSDNIDYDLFDYDYLGTDDYPSQLYQDYENAINPNNYNYTSSYQKLIYDGNTNSFNRFIGVCNCFVEFGKSSSWLVSVTDSGDTKLDYILSILLIPFNLIYNTFKLLFDCIGALISNPIVGPVEGDIRDYGGFVYEYHEDYGWVPAGGNII